MAQNQVLALPDGSVTSRITWDTIYQLLRQPNQKGETVPFQLMPGVPIQGQGRTFSHLACLAGGVAQPTRILMEEYSGRPGVPGQYALGVPEDIAKGVEYLQKAGDYVEVKEELRHYKKTLFGKWVRR